MNSNDPRSSDFSYNKYSLEQLDNWVNDALNCEDLSPQDIYDTIVKCVDESVEYHKKYLTKSIDLLSLLKGHRPVDFDYTATGEKFPSIQIKYDDHMESHVPYVCDRDDSSPECKKNWADFWEENYYPEEYYPHPGQKQYTEEEMNAMCEQAASEVEKNKCREYNLREAEYYNKPAQSDSLYDEIKKAGGYEWTPESNHSKYYYDFDRNK